MSIGILTFHNACNYGAALQAYSLVDYLNNQGVDTYIVGYENHKIKSSYSINPFTADSIKQFIKRFLYLPKMYRQKNAFMAFQKKNLRISKECTLDNYTTLITGSDQIWNEKITDSDQTYFLGTCKTGQLLFSYAASANDSFQCSKNLEKYLELLRRFKMVSVRERKLQKILEANNIESKLVCDPVFLNNIEYWRKREKIVRIHKKFILVYILDYSKKIEEFLDQISEKKNLDIVLVHPTRRRLYKKGKMYASIDPFEFLWLVDNCEFVVSNSFHAFSFSCIFNKKIYFETITGLSSRVENLIDVLNIDIGSELGLSCADFNNNSVNLEKNKFIVKSKLYLEEILNYEKNV